jgi:hypothetical protein
VVRKPKNRDYIGVNGFMIVTQLREAAFGALMFSLDGQSAASELPVGLFGSDAVDRSLGMLLWRWRRMICSRWLAHREACIQIPCQSRN